jgi:hypothetical protein
MVSYQADAIQIPQIQLWQRNMAGLIGIGISLNLAIQPPSKDYCQEFHKSPEEYRKCINAYDETMVDLMIKGMGVVALMNSIILIYGIQNQVGRV